MKTSRINKLERLAEAISNKQGNDEEKALQRFKKVLERLDVDVLRILAREDSEQEALQSALCEVIDCNLVPDCYGKMVTFEDIRNSLKLYNYPKVNMWVKLIDDYLETRGKQENRLNLRIN